MKRIVFASLALLLLLTGCTCIPGMGNEPPVAYIDTISPATAAYGEAVNFTGHGIDANGSVVGYNWRSSIDGDLSALTSFDSASLSEGAHIIYFKVQDNNGAWSEEVESPLTIGAMAASPGEESPYETGPGAPGEPGPSTTLPYINYLTADPGAISPGGSSTVSWSVSNADSVTISYGMSTNAVPLTSSATARPTTTTTYTLTATGGGTSVSATVDVVVSGAGAPPAAGAGLPVINLFTADPQSIMHGGSTTLSYDVSNADSITLSSTAGSKVSSMIHSSGSFSAEPTSTTVYTITATNSAGSVTATAKVTVGTVLIVPGVTLAAKTKELSLVLSESGSINSDHVVGPKLITGDAGTNKTYWAYFSFNISSIAGKEVTKAQLVYSPSSLNGHPWPNLNSLGIYQINHGPRSLQPSDFAFIGPTIVDGLIQIQTVVPADVTSQVASAAAASAPRFQVRLTFLRMTDSNGEPDNIGWTSTTPRLKVTYR